MPTLNVASFTPALRTVPKSGLWHISSSLLLPSDRNLRHGPRLRLERQRSISRRASHLVTFATLPPPSVARIVERPRPIAECRDAAILAVDQRHARIAASRCSCLLRRACWVGPWVSRVRVNTAQEPGDLLSFLGPCLTPLPSKLT